jgi:hypothetical protein
MKIICMHIVSRSANRVETSFPSYAWSWWEQLVLNTKWHGTSSRWKYIALSRAQLIKSYTFITANLFIIYVSLQLVCTIYFHYQQYHYNLCMHHQYHHNLYFTTIIIIILTIVILIKSKISYFTPLIYYLIAQGQGHFTSLQDLNTGNHLFAIILKEKQTTNVLLAHLYHNCHKITVIWNHILLY